MTRGNIFLVLDRKGLTGLKSTGKVHENAPQASSKSHLRGIKSDGCQSGLSGLPYKQVSLSGFAGSNPAPSGNVTT